jgi:hypothetical protein
MRTVDRALPEDIFHEISSFFSYDDDSDTLLICALVSRSCAWISRRRSTLRLSRKNFRDLQGLLESPLTTFPWVRNLVVHESRDMPTAADWFHETIPHLAVLKRVESLSLVNLAPFSNFDELLNALCVFPSLHSVLLSGIRVSDWTWYKYRPRHRPTLSNITLEAENRGIIQWLQSQTKIHPVRSFSAVIVDREELELMDKFLQPSADILQHLHITFRSWDASKGSENYLP